MGCFLAIIGIFLVIIAFSTGPVGGFILLTIFSFIAWYWYKHEKEKSEIERKVIEEQEIYVADRTKLKMRELNFNISQKFDDVRHSNKNKFLAIDQSAKRIALVDNGVWHTFDLKDILESRIIEDGQDVITTSRSSQVGRALVGAVIAGGVGAIIGGVGATQEQKSEVNRISLKIVVNDIRNPSFTLEFLEKSKVIKGDASYKEAMSNASKCHDTISVLIRQADEVDNHVPQIEATEGAATTKEVSSVADELEKLFSLKEKGILSNEEFEIQKNKLLNG